MGDSTPIEMISAYDSSEVEEEARASGITGFITKPLFRSTLYRKLRGFLPDTADSDTPRDTPEGPVLDGMRVLLAEDNDINAEIAQVILEEIGIEAERAEDGQRALDMFTQSGPGYYSAILMDLRMPHMDGLEAAAAIRASQRQDAASIPIIAMTADAFTEDVQKCLDAGMNAHLAKPIDIDQLKKTFEKFL